MFGATTTGMTTRKMAMRMTTTMIGIGTWKGDIRALSVLSNATYIQNTLGIALGEFTTQCRGKC